jgi:hypothetical protein
VDSAARKWTLWEWGINVVPKREPGGRKKLSTGAQQKTHAFEGRAISRQNVIWVSFFSFQT